MSDAREPRGTPPSPSLLLGRFREEGFLGAGGLGVVVKAFDIRLKRLVAIKTIKRDTMTTDRLGILEERFEREAEAGARMGTHPNIVAVHDYLFGDDNIPYLILEFVPGGTLAERIERGPLGSAEALQLTADVAAGLQAAHDAGVVHRDIKPSNIFLATNERAQVGDFGAAQIEKQSRRTQMTTGHPGTPLYMSPEQGTTTGYLGPASDQYSLGLVLFEMLAGRPFKRLHATEAASVLASQPAAIRELFAQLTATEPGDRYPSMRAVQAAARHALRGLPAPAPYDDVPSALWDASIFTAPTYVPTPPINLMPHPPVRAAEVAEPSLRPVTAASPRTSRRALLFGVVGAAGAAVAGGAAVYALVPRPGPGSGVTATATPATAALAPTATALPAITAPVALAATLPQAAATAVPMPPPPVIVAPTVAPSPTAATVPTAALPPPTMPTTVPTAAPTLPTGVVLTPAVPSPTAPAAAPTTVPTVTPATPTVMLMPTATAPPAAPVFNPQLALIGFGTTNENKVPGPGDPVRAFPRNGTVYIWLYWGGAKPGDAIAVSFLVSGSGRAGFSVPLPTPDGSAVVPAGMFPPGMHEAVAVYFGMIARKESFTVQ